MPRLLSLNATSTKRTSNPWKDVRKGNYNNLENVVWTNSNAAICKNHPRVLPSFEGNEVWHPNVWVVISVNITETAPAGSRAEYQLFIIPFSGILRDLIWRLDPIRVQADSSVWAWEASIASRELKSWLPLELLASATLKVWPQLSAYRWNLFSDPLIESWIIQYQRSFEKKDLRRNWKEDQRLTMTPWTISWMAWILVILSLISLWYSTMD